MTKILFFTAPWCQPCKAMKLELEGLPGLEIIDIGDESNAPIARKYRVMSTPTVVILRDGVPVWFRSGVVSRAEVEEALKGSN